MVEPPLRAFLRLILDWISLTRIGFGSIDRITRFGGESMRILVLFCVMAFPLLAQIGGSGSIQGVVSDPSGAVIPGATVVAARVGTGLKTVRQTTGAGLYVLSPLDPGEYKGLGATPRGACTALRLIRRKSTSKACR